MPSRSAHRWLFGLAWRTAFSPFVLVALGCGTVKSPTEPPPPPPPSTAYSFTRIQGEIFSPVCARSGCHDAATATNGLVLEAGVSYGLLVDRPALENSSLDRIEPGDPERSYLIKKIRGDTDIVGERMPLIGGPLSQAQIDGIAAWVAAGAPDN